MSFLDQLKAAEQLDGGSGGYVGKVKVEMGYKIFVAGLSNTDSWFGYEPTDKAAVAKAMGAAKQASPAGSKDPKPSIQFTMFKDSVKGREVTWKGDRVFTYQTWTPSFQQIIKPELERLAKEGKFPSLGEYWARLTFKQEPTGRVKADQNGELKPELIAYLAEIFASEADATKASASTGDVSESNGNGHVTNITQWMDVAGDTGFAQELKAAAGTVKAPPQKLAALKAKAVEWGMTEADATAHVADMKVLAGI